MLDKMVDETFIAASRLLPLTSSNSSSKTLWLWFLKSLLLFYSGAKGQKVKSDLRTRFGGQLRGSWWLISSSLLKQWCAVGHVVKLCQIFNGDCEKVLRLPDKKVVENSRIVFREKPADVFYINILLQMSII